MTFDEFLVIVMNRPIPANPMARVQTYARELAEGASYGLWNPQGIVSVTQFSEFNEGQAYEALIHQPEVTQYIKNRWTDFAPPVRHILSANDLIRFDTQTGTTRLHDTMFVTTCSLTEKAFGLIGEAQRASVFISYKRSESSAFALLVDTVLRQAGLNPYVDMQLEAGNNWRDQLHRKIEEVDFLILLLAPETLTSTVTLQEIEWAMAADTTVLPIWHNGFSFRADDWADLPEGVALLLSDTHTIRVTEENPLAYNTAMTELLNRFGITL